MCAEQFILQYDPVILKKCTFILNICYTPPPLSVDNGDPGVAVSQGPVRLYINIYIY